MVCRQRTGLFVGCRCGGRSTSSSIIFCASIPLFLYGLVATPARSFYVESPRLALTGCGVSTKFENAIRRSNCPRVRFRPSTLLHDYSTSAIEDDLQLKELESEISKQQFRDVEPALRAYIASHPLSWKAYYFLGYVLFREQRLTEAIKSLSKSLELNRNDAEVHNLLGRCLMVAMRSDLAAREFREALRLDPGSADAHYNLARVYSMQDDFPRAKKEFECAIKLNPDYMEAYNALGFTLEALGDDAGARADYEMSIKINERRGGGFAAPYVNLSGYYNTHGSTDRALEYARQALAADAQSDLAYFQMARACRAQRNWKCVVQVLQDAIRIRASSPQYFYVLGIAYRELGQTQESNRALEKFRELEKHKADLERQIREVRRKGSDLDLRPEN
jgi:tetratricopeptide (TPR) repeat protein